MNPIKSNKSRLSLKQKTKLRLLIIVGISAAILSIVFIIYFQFFQNEIIRAKNIETLTQDNLPVELNVENQIIENTDTLMRNGIRFKVAKPLSETPVAPVQ